MINAYHSITVSEKLPNKGAGILLSYDHQDVQVKNWITIDARSLISENEEAWFYEIQKWHSSICKIYENENKYWWLTPGSRLIIWKSFDVFHFKPLLFFLAVVQLFERYDCNIWIVGGGDELALYLREWKRDGGSVNNFHVDINIGLNIFFDFGYRFLRPLLNLSKGVLRNLILLIHSQKNNIKSGSVVISSMIFNTNVLRFSGDHYFGRMFDLGFRPGEDNFLWAYGDGVAIKNSAEGYLSANKRNYIFCNDFISLGDLFFSIMAAVRLRKKNCTRSKKVESLVINSRKLNVFTKRFINTLINQQFPVDAFVKYRQFTRILNESKASTVVYPYEEQIYERAILFAAQEQPRAIRTIGFAHATYSNGHLFLSRSQNGHCPRPDAIGVTGEIAKHFFMCHGFKSDELYIVGSPRFSFSSPEKVVVGAGAKPKLLLICSFGFEFLNFASIVINNKSKFSKYEIAIRRSYHSWRAEQDEAERMLQVAQVQYKCEPGDLKEQIAWADIVFFELTTAGLEASLQGKYIVRLSLNEVLPGILFPDYLDKNIIPYCKTADEFFLETSHFLSLERGNQIKKIADQQNLVSRLISPVNQKTLHKMLISK